MRLPWEMAVMVGKNWENNGDIRLCVAKDIQFTSEFPDPVVRMPSFLLAFPNGRVNKCLQGGYESRRGPCLIKQRW